MRLTNDQMYTVTVTVDENAVGRIFIDGQLAFERQFANDVRLNNNEKLFIGTWAYTNFYGMTLESVHIYDRALEPVEVLMNHVDASGGA